MLDARHRSSEEVDLVRQVCANNPEAISNLYCNFLLPIAKTVIRALRAQSVDPEELANTLFIRLSEKDWHSLRTWEGTNLPGWLWRVGYRSLLGILKESGRCDPLTDWHEASLAQDDTVLHQLLRDETGFLLLEAIDNLDSPRDRRVLRLHYLQSKELAEVADEVGVLVATAYVIKSRALARLRTILEGRATNAGASRA